MLIDTTGAGKQSQRDASSNKASNQGDNVPITRGQSTTTPRLPKVE